MTDFSKIQISSLSDKSGRDASLSNPLSANTENLPSGYTQTLPRNTYDNDMAEVLEVVRILNNMAPIRMPVYNFNANEINGDAYYKPDGQMLLIREYSSDLVRDYYISAENSENVSRILEHDRFTGKLRAKIEPNSRTASRSKTNITEFSGKGQAFQTLYRNVQTLKPARYLAGKDVENKGFEMVDCIFDNNGNIARIKRYNSKKEVNIEYTDDRKNITVKNK